MRLRLQKLRKSIQRVAIVTTIRMAIFVIFLIPKGYFCKAGERLIEVVRSDLQFLIGIVEDGTKLLFGEVSIFPPGDRGFDDCHAAEVAQEVGSLDFDWVYVPVAQHNEKPTVSAVLLPCDYAEVW